MNFDEGQARGHRYRQPLAERRVETPWAVFQPPLLNRHLRLLQRLEKLSMQAFIPLLLRRAGSKVMMNVHTQAITETKRKADSRVVSQILRAKIGEGGMMETDFPSGTSTNAGSLGRNSRKSII